MIKKILIVGLGTIGERHLSLAKQLLPDSVVKVLRHERNDKLLDKNQEYLFDFDEVISFSPDIAIVAGPASHHVDIAMKLARLGVHIMIEKPLAESLSGVSELINLCNSKNIVLFCGYNLRFLKSLQFFRAALLDQLIVGNILSVRCEVGQYLPSWRPNLDYRKSVSAKQSLGGGVLLELSHELDYLRWIFGEVNWVSAYVGKQSDLKIDVEDTAMIVLGFEPMYSSSQQLVAALNMDFVRHDKVRTCTVIGKNGSLRWDGLSGLVERFYVGSGRWEIIFKDEDSVNQTYLAEWKNFLSCVFEGKSPLITGNDGMKVLEIIQACRDSARSGLRVVIAN